MDGASEHALIGDLAPFVSIIGAWVAINARYFWQTWRLKNENSEVHRHSRRYQ